MRLLLVSVAVCAAALLFAIFGCDEFDHNSYRLYEYQPTPYDDDLSPAASDDDTYPPLDDDIDASPQPPSIPAVPSSPVFSLKPQHVDLLRGPQCAPAR